MLFTVTTGTEIALRTYAMIRPSVPRNDLDHLSAMQIVMISPFLLGCIKLTVSRHRGYFDTFNSNYVIHAQLSGV
jgi:hypothetical protein